MELSPGALIAEKYELERRIGVGGMGEVWAAVQRPTRKHVALKFLRAAKAEEDPREVEATRRRFVREARAACAVQHPNVVEIHDVLELEDGSPVMVMEYLHGESLEARLGAAGKLPLGEVAAILARVTAAVGSAHALGIVHRDLKPDNIFLAETPGGVEVKVLDFGIAKLTALEGDAAQTGGLTSTGAMLGTPYYMSPEQAFGERNVDRRADVWSLGIILYRALTGVLPTRAENIGQILKIIMMEQIRPIGELAPELPEDVRDLVGRMLAAKREDRPGDLREVNEILARYAGLEVASFGPPADAEAPPEPARPSQPRTPGAERGESSVAGVSRATAPSSSRRRAPLVALGALLLVGGGAAWLALGSRSERTPTAAVGADEADSAAAPPPPAPAPGPSGSPSPASSPSAAIVPPPAPPASLPATPSAAAPPASPGAPTPRPPSSGRPLAAPPAQPPTAAPTAAPTADAPSMGGVIATPPQF